MKLRSSSGLLAAAALAGGGAAGVGLAALPAGATATQVPVAAIGPIPFSPIGSGQGVRVVNCPDWVTNDTPVIVFDAANAHFYGQTNDNNVLVGGNAEGDAVITFYNSANEPDGSFEGHTHAWFNDITGTNGHFYTGQTASLHDVGVNGTSGTIDIEASGGENISASGNVSGWGHINVTCG